MIAGRKTCCVPVCTQGAIRIKLLTLLNCNLPHLLKQENIRGFSHHRFESWHGLTPADGGGQRSAK